MGRSSDVDDISRQCANSDVTGTAPDLRPPPPPPPPPPYERVLSVSDRRNTAHSETEPRQPLGLLNGLNATCTVRGRVRQCGVVPTPRASGAGVRPRVGCRDGKGDPASNGGDTMAASIYLLVPIYNMMK